MSLTVLFQITDAASPTIQALRATVENRTLLNQAAADALADGIKDHFQELENGPHASASALGAEPTGFWARMQAGTVARADDRSGTVAMPREVAQRRFGGDLKPTGGRTYITIAAIAAAYGKVAADFPDLHFGFARNTFGVMQPAMVQDDVQAPKKTGKNRTHTAIGAAADGTLAERTHQIAYFWLTTEVHQNPDPDALPSDAVMQAYAEHGVGEMIESIKKNGGR